jgi:Predicted nucleic acid-binding protein, contains PIN domain
MNENYMVDTSIWIDYFRNAHKERNNLIDSLIDENRVYINGIILSELLLGARNENDFNALASTMRGLNFVDIDQNGFELVGRNGFLLKKKGISIPLSDLVIASNCIEHDLVLIDNDKHFKTISSHLKLKRFIY